MRYAVFADIHGNLEALQAALEYTQKHSLSHYLVLGDSVGYGANPNECLEWSFENAEFHVIGNHEEAVIDEELRFSFHDWARVAIDWTAEQMRPDHLSKIKGLSYLQIHQGFTLGHATLHSPERFDYIFDFKAAQKSFMAMQSPVGFVGHSHIPCFFSEREKDAGHLKEGILKLKKGERYLFNPGSIGQPRDKDTRLSFGVFDDEELTFEIVRLPYDNKTAAQKILDAGLPRFLADRLL